MHSSSPSEAVVAPEVIELEAFAADNGVPMPEALAHAGVAKTTYWRWRHAGTEPHTPTLRKLKSSISVLSEARAS
jgi:hypothetical protein